MNDVIDKNDLSMYLNLDEDTFTAIQVFTRNARLDGVIDIMDLDGENAYFHDFENDCAIPFVDGIAFLFEAISYPCQHDGLSIYQGGLLIDLFKKYCFGDEKWYKWYLSNEE